MAATETCQSNKEWQYDSVAGYHKEPFCLSTYNICLLMLSLEIKRWSSIGCSIRSLHYAVLPKLIQAKTLNHCNSVVLEGQNNGIEFCMTSTDSMQCCANWLCPQFML